MQSNRLDFSEVQEKEIINRLETIMSKVENLDCQNPEFIRSVYIFDRIKSDLTFQFGDLSQLNFYSLINYIDLKIAQHYQ